MRKEHVSHGGDPGHSPGSRDIPGRTHRNGGKGEDKKVTTKRVAGAAMAKSDREPGDAL